MRFLTIAIEEVSDENGKGYCARIPELNNSLICADTIDEIFKLVPEAIAEAKKYSFGVYADSAAGGGKVCATAGRKKGAKQSV